MKLSNVFCFVGMVVHGAQGSASFANNGVNCASQLFRRLEGKERERSLGNGMDFNESEWVSKKYDDPSKKDILPKRLPAPSFLQVFEYKDDEQPDGSSPSLDLQQLGKTVSDIIESNLSQTGALLFRNMPIDTPSDFGRFIKAVECWQPMRYCNFGIGRQQVAGIDLSTNIPPSHTLQLHNEMAYSPKPPRRIAFYCLQPAAIGGESLLGTNQALTDVLPQNVLEEVRNCGGILYIRRHFDEHGPAGPDPSQLRLTSWQSKCYGATTIDEARQYFINQGYKDVDVDDENTITARFVHNGFVKDASSSDDVWFNIINTGLPTMVDGTKFPARLVALVEWYQWKVATVVKLRKNDWLVLDNQRVLHGRLPYQDGEGFPRQLLTVYSS